MSNTSFKIEDYKLATFYIQDAKTENIKAEILSKSNTPATEAFLKVSPFVLDLSQCSNLSDFDYKEVSEYTKGRGFTLVGIAGTISEEAFSSLKDCDSIPLIVSRMASKPTVTQQSNQTVEQDTPKAEVTEKENCSEEKKQTDSKPIADATSTTPLPTGEQTQIHTVNVRSGNQIYAKDKSLVVIGNVSDGANVIADDSIYIFGTAKGTIVANAKQDSNKKVIVYCKNLQAQIVSISGIYKTYEDLDPSVIGQPVIIEVENNTLRFTKQV
jgi:septum site-determining protein MinC